MSTVDLPAADVDTPVQAGDALAQESWPVRTRNGLVMHLPPTLNSLSTYVMLEQERWFEPEMSLLPLLLEPDAQVLDIGANHGAYALEIARRCSRGHVWAFEPTSAPRTRLLASVQANGLQDRITVIAAALADSDGEASFAVHDNSELNSRSGVGACRETVRQRTLDGYLQEQGITGPIALVKLDAEGDEERVLAGAAGFLSRQSPVVLFEYMHGRVVNRSLLGVWARLGFDIFRWSAELELLLPFQPAGDDSAFALNLVAVRPAQQQALLERGLLVTDDALRTTTVPQPEPWAVADLCAFPGLLRLRVPSPEGLLAEIETAAGSAYALALSEVAAAHLQANLSGAQRLALMLQARDRLLDKAGVLAQGSVAGWALLVHCLHALGQPQAAVQAGQHLLQRWVDDDDLAVPVMPPRHADLQRRRSTAIGSWLRQVIGEFVQGHRAYSTYFARPEPELWEALLKHPDHDAEIERRYVLTCARAERLASVDALTLLPAGGASCNPQIWDGILASTRLLASVAAAAAAAPRPEDVLDALPVPAVTIVDVGASSMGHETEPYAALVRRGQALVTGFEPDAQALALLQQANPDAATHRFLPHIVGNGDPAAFHEMQWSLTSSLLPPERAVLDRYQHLGELVQLKARHDVQTVRLDDVIAAGGMDLLKIDVQGAEGLVFDGAARRLDECLAVWTEVEFVPLYQDQPLFGDVDAKLRGHGLQFLCFVGLAHRALTSWPLAGVPAPRRAQQLWADAIYVPGPQRMANLGADAAARLALIAHHVLQASDLCHAALQRYDLVSGTDHALRYLAAMRASAQ